MSAERGCVFCQIVRGEREASIVFEDQETLAFLDHRPLFPGHCLLIPKEHHQTLPDLPSALVGAFFSNAQLLARAVEAAVEAEGTFLAINNRVSQSVPHLHLHIVPRRRGDGLKGFFWPRRKYKDQEEERKVGQRISAHVAALLRERAAR
jgi:histidine triad (HIT) family protein